jgi:hypothetical protein
MVKQETSWQQRLEQRLMSVREIAVTKPGVALVEARIAVELMAAAIYQEVFGSAPPRGDLDSRLSTLEGADAMPRRVQEYLRCVQRMGNLAAHATGPSDAPFTFDEALPALLCLGLASKWLVNAYPRVRENLSPVIYDLLQFGRGSWTATPRLAMDLSLRETSNTFDTEHLYERIRRYDVADLTKGEYRTYRWLTIKNASNRATRFVTIYESGENRVRYDQMQVQAWLDSHEGQRLARESLQPPDMPEFVQVFRIFFPRALPPGAVITIYYSLIWPGEPPTSYPDVNYSHSMAIHRYRRGVNRVDLYMIDAREILSATVSRFDLDRLETFPNDQAEALSANEVAELAALGERIQSGVRFSFNQPHPAAYRVYVRVGGPDQRIED